MRSPASAIVWEIWLKNRRGFLAVLGSFLCGLAVLGLGTVMTAVLGVAAGDASVCPALSLFAGQTNAGTPLRAALDAASQCYFGDTTQEEDG